MKSLYDIYNEYLQNARQYYGDIFFDIDSLNDDELCKNLIIRILTMGEKVDCNIVKSINDLTAGRAKHTVSLWVLGCVFYNYSFNVRNQINKLLEIEPFISMSDDCTEHRFSYIWLITCLFHDLGYIYEAGIEQISKSELSFPPKRYSHGIPKVYTKNLVFKYLNYRKSEHKKDDHGILGGMVYFYQMCELRRNKENGPSNHYWGMKMEKVYAYISWIIICHNIFFHNRVMSKDTTTEDLYNSFGLENLIIDKAMISISHHPFLYIFCLLDSIEPLKVITDVDNLKNIKILFERSSVTLYLNN